MDRQARVGVFARALFHTICGWRRRRRWNDRKLFTQNETLPNHSFLHVLIDAKAIVLDNHIEICMNERNSSMFTWRLCLHTYACWWCKFNCVVCRLVVLYIRFQFTLFHYFCFLHFTSLSCPSYVACLYNSFHLLSLLCALLSHNGYSREYVRFRWPFIVFACLFDSVLDHITFNRRRIGFKPIIPNRFVY